MILCKELDSVVTPVTFTKTVTSTLCKDHISLYKCTVAEELCGFSLKREPLYMTKIVIIADFSLIKLIVCHSLLNLS